jgi:hypothetical protein
MMRNTTMLQDLIKVSVLSVIVAMALPDASLAATAGTVGGILDATTTNVSTAPRLISAAAYIIGLILLVSGALSLKKHSENPSSEPLGKGLGRVLVGGVVMSLPSLANLITKTLGTDASAVAYTAVPSVTP